MSKLCYFRINHVVSLWYIESKGGLQEMNIQAYINVILDIVYMLYHSAAKFSNLDMRLIHFLYQHIIQINGLY